MGSVNSITTWINDSIFLNQANVEKADRVGHLFLDVDTVSYKK